MENAQQLCYIITDVIKFSQFINNYTNNFHKDLENYLILTLIILFFSLGVILILIFILTIFVRYDFDHQNHNKP